jgi:hypothetical protein
MDWIDLVQDKDHWRALVNTVMNLRTPQNAGKLLNSCTIGGFSRRVQSRFNSGTEHALIALPQLVYSIRYIAQFIKNG